MSRDLNLCQFIGRLGKDPEIRYMPNGNAVANFSIACGDDYKDKNTGQNVEQTNWVNVVIFGRLAEIVQQYVHRSSKIYISGKQVTRKWQDQSGQDRYTTEIVAENMQMLDGKPEGGQGNQGQQYNQAPQQQRPQPQQQRPQQQHQAPQQQNNNQGGAQPNFDDFDNDIPFAVIDKWMIV